MTTEKLKDAGLRLIESPSDFESSHETNMTLDEERLDEICLIEADEEDVKSHLQILKDPRRKQRAIDTLSALVEQDFKGIAGMEKETDQYKLHLEACEALRPSAKTALALMKKDELDEEESALLELSLEKVARLLALKKEIWAYLNQEYYPRLYESVMNTARAEVMQFLIMQANTRELDEFKLTSEVDITLMNKLQFIARHGNYQGMSMIPSFQPVAANPFSKAAIEPKPPTYPDLRAEISINAGAIKTDWDLFHKLVHELAHTVSLKIMGETGIYNHADRSERRDYVMLNECVTEMVALGILDEHLKKGKTFIQDQRPLEASEIGYRKFIPEFRKILDKIPLHFFVDAMLNRGGMPKLIKEFERVFDDPKALNKFAKKLNEADSELTERNKAIY